MRSMRFNPARAGNSSGATFLSNSVSVQPRSRGELTWSLQAGHNRRGSTPLARGTLAEKEPRKVIKSVQPRSRGELDFSTGSEIVCGPVQPRSRGELTSSGAQIFDIAGSTPLARGTQPKVPTKLTRGRFNPARAGNT